MKKYYGNYRGIIKSVVDGGMGRCKIFVPGVYPKEFETKYKSLPIAEPALPLMNGNYNDIENKDANDLTELTNVDITAQCDPKLLKEFGITDIASANAVLDVMQKYADGKGGIITTSAAGGSISELYTKYFPGKTGKTFTSAFKAKFPCLYTTSDIESTINIPAAQIPEFNITEMLGVDIQGIANSIIPIDLENSATGAISYPTKGSRVWVFFEGGDPNYPIYFAATHGGDSFIPATVGEIVNHTKSLKLTINEEAFVESTDVEVQLDENGNPIVDPRRAHLPIIKYNSPEWDGTLWKPINDSMTGSILMFRDNKTYLDEYKQKKWEACVISKKPWGDPILPGGKGRIVAPYEGKSATIRFDVLGKTFGSSKVYAVLIYKDGTKKPFEIPNPAMRITKNSITVQQVKIEPKETEVEGEKKPPSSPQELGTLDQTTPEFAGLLAGLGAQVAGLPAMLQLLKGLDIKYSCDTTGMATLDISFNGALSLNINGSVMLMQSGDSVTLRAGNTSIISNGSIMEAHTGGGLSYP